MFQLPALQSERCNARRDCHRARDLGTATLGVSLVASGLRRKCGICGHQRAEHRAELVANVGDAMQSQQPTDDQMALQLEQQRQLAAASGRLSRCIWRSSRP